MSSTIAVLASAWRSCDCLRINVAQTGWPTVIHDKAVIVLNTLRSVAHHVAPED